MPYVSQAQRRFFHSAGAKRAGISKAMVSEWDTASKGKKLPEKKKIKYKMGVDNKLKGSYGMTIIEKGKTPVVKINVKRHNGNKAELADTIKHELLHVKHPKMTEKEVYKKTKGKMSAKEQDQMIAKLHKKHINYRMGAAKRVFKKSESTQPGDLINKSKELSHLETVAIAGLV
jgi:hypothetical protein